MENDKKFEIPQSICISTSIFSAVVLLGVGYFLFKVAGATGKRKRRVL